MKHDPTIELREYSSYAYKLMVFMGILIDIVPKWKDNFDSSESMFAVLTDLITEHESIDDDELSWHDSVAKFLKETANYMKDKQDDHHYHDLGDERIMKHTRMP